MLVGILFFGKAFSTKISDNFFNRVSIKDLDRPALDRILIERKLPLNVLDVPLSEKVSAYKHFSVTKGNKRQVFYTRRYDKNNEITASQLKFHLALLPKITARGFFPFETHWFDDERWTYLVHTAQEKPLPYLHHEFPKFDLQRAGEVLLALRKTLKSIENRNGVFSSFVGNTLLITADLQVVLSPLTLMHLCPEKCKCYVAGHTWFALEEQPQDSSIESYVEIEAQKRWNRYYFAYQAEELVKFYSNRRLPVHELITLLIFGNRLEILGYMVQSSTRARWGWTEIKEFVRSWGQEGTLARMMGGIQINDFPEHSQEASPPRSPIVKEKSSIQKIPSKKIEKKTSNSNVSYPERDFQEKKDSSIQEKFSELIPNISYFPNRRHSFPFAKEALKGRNIAKGEEVKFVSKIKKHESMPILIS